MLATIARATATKLAMIAQAKRGLKRTKLAKIARAKRAKLATIAQARRAKCTPERQNIFYVVWRKNSKEKMIFILQVNDERSRERILVLL